jgi:hypothetical protein
MNRLNRLFSLKHLIVAAVGLACGTARATPVVIFSDDFSSGTVAPWRAVTAVNLSIGDPGGFGTGPALFANPTDSVNRTMVAFPQVTLAQAGDWIEVEFDFLFRGTLTAARFTPVFGLYNAARTVGYTAVVSSLGSGADPTRGLGRDTESTSGILAGTDTYNLFSATGTPVLTNTAPYTFRLRATRNVAAGVDLDFAVTGTPAFTMTATSSTSPLFDFAEFGIRTRSNDYAIDNVVIRAVIVPEPEAVPLVVVAGLAAAAWAARRRRFRPA